MKSLASFFISLLLLVLLVGSGGAAVYLFDRRPADFPSIHLNPHFWFIDMKWDWSAPDSLKVASYKAGASAQGRQDISNCLDLTKHIRAQLDEQTAAAEKAHAEELQIEKNVLRAQQEAILARKKEAWTLAGIDHMKTSGNSCQRAEQIIRGVIK